MLVIIIIWSLLEISLKYLEILDISQLFESSNVNAPYCLKTKKTKNLPANIFFLSFSIFIFFLILFPGVELGKLRKVKQGDWALI